MKLRLKYTDNGALLQEKQCWYMPWETTAKYLVRGNALYNALERTVLRKYGKAAWIRLQIWIVKHPAR